MEEQTGDTASVSDWLPDRHIYAKLRLISGRWNPPCYDTVSSSFKFTFIILIQRSVWTTRHQRHRRRAFQSESNSTEVWRDKTTMTSATEGLHGHTGPRWSTSSNKVNTNKADMHRSTSWKHRVWIPQDLVTVIFSLLYLLFSMNSFYTAHSFFFTQFATAIVVRTINNNSGDICSSFILFGLAAAWCVCGLWFL